MGKYNKKTSIKIADLVNLAGGVAYSYSDERKEIASVILSSMINGDSFYETEAKRIDRIMTKTEDTTLSEFIAKCMVYVRNEGNLRTVSHLLAIGLVKNAKGTTYLRSALNKTLVRPDDATEMVALWNSRSKKSIPNVLRRSIKDTLETKWDAYSLKKYFGTGSVKVSDLIKMTHPKEVKEGQAIMWKQAIEGTLPNISTSQTVNAGSTGEERAENYKVMLKERKLGIMAALKNIVNIVEAGADTETIDMLCVLFENERAVTNSRLLPFRFEQAYNMVETLAVDKFLVKKLQNSIEKAFIISAGNLELISENETIALLLDESGSMGWSNNMTSGKQPFDIGKTLMASMLVNLDKSRALGYLWADSAREVNISGSPMKFIKDTTTQGGGTNLHAAIADLIKTKTKVDKLVIFTDMQQNGVRGFKESVDAYRKISPGVKILFWNLAGYGDNTPIKLSHDVLEVSGFSDNILKVIPKMWRDKDALIQEIENIEL